MGIIAMRQVALRSSRLGIALVACWCVIASQTAAAETGIYVMRADGGGQREVASVELAVSHSSPRWSHDGERLAFEAIDESGTRRSYIVKVDGTELKEVATLGHPDWSPDDKQLVLDGDDSNTSAIFVQNVDGSGRTRLADGAWPRWSRDATRIAFCDGNTLRVLDLELGEQYSLCEGIFVQRPGSFDWSRDGKRLALFTRTADGGPRELYIINADEPSEAIKPRYSRPGMVGGHVTWSPDDKQLIFTIDSKIHALDVEGDAEPRLVANQSDMNRDPAISPDGKWIAFVRRPG